MNEPSSHVIRPQVGVLLSGRHGNIPDTPPGIVERLVHRIDSGVVGGDRVVGSEGGDGVFLRVGV